MNIQRKEKGFTIIEVVLVLAIAGLIFLMVFLALPALQRNQRDTQRKGDMSRVQTALTSYGSNNRGAVPKADTASLTAFESSYLAVNNDSFVDPSGVPSTGKGVSSTTPPTYVFKVGTAATAITGTFADNQNAIYYTPSATCDPNDSSNTVASTTRTVTFQMMLEGGGVNCINN